MAKEMIIGADEDDLLEGPDVDGVGGVRDDNVDTEDFPEPMIKSKGATAREIDGIRAIVSPLEIGNANELRSRTGYHQTWLRSDNVMQYKEVGYRHIRKPKLVGGKLESAGKETGEVLRKNEGDGRFLYAMEVRLELYEQHLDSVVVASHARYMSQGDVLREYTDKTNRDIGGRLEVIEEHEDYAEQLNK